MACGTHTHTVAARRHAIDKYQTRQDKGNAQRTCRTIKRAIKTTEHNKNYILFYFCVLWLSLSLFALSFPPLYIFKYTVKGSTHINRLTNYTQIFLGGGLSWTSTWTLTPHTLNNAPILGSPTPTICACVTTPPCLPTAPKCDYNLWTFNCF